MKQILIAALAIFFLTPIASIAKDDDGGELKGRKRAAGIEGVWGMKGEDGARRLKYIVGGMWTITQFDPATGEVVIHHGGRYTFDGETYVESVEFANGNTANLIGAKHTFKVKVSGDKLNQEGVGNPWTQEWSRVKAK